MGILGLIGVIVIVVGWFLRKGLYGASSVSQSISVSRMKKDPSRAIKYAEGIDLPFTKRKEITPEGFELICSRVQSATAIGDYRLLYTQRLDKNQLLILTELTYNDYVVDLRGNSYDTKKKALFDFLFRYDPADQELSALSHLSTNAVEKNQRMEFVQALFSGKV